MAGQEPILEGMAGRYASALFELARDSNALDQVGSDLKALSSFIAESDDLTRLVRSPVFGASEQQKAMSEILKRMNAHGLTQKFMGLVIQNRRLFAVTDMIKAYQVILADHRGEMTADVIAAQPLGDSQVASLKQTLKQTYAREVSLDVSVDDTLIGGLIVKVGSRMVDYSLKTKLDNLRIAMKEA